jgi:tripartite-type tricarboxylate transporter receptor subunit TctC
MRRLLALWAAALLLLAAGAAAAEEYPSKPVRVIVSFPPGSTPDLTARAVAPALAQLLGQPFVVDDRSGAGGNIGADAVAKAAPDGYTLLVSTNGPVSINQALYPEMPYDPMRDLAPISLLVTAPQILAVGKDVPVKSVAEFVAYARANPGKMSYGTVGTGSAGHLTMEDLKLREGLDIVHVPYRGFPPAMLDLLSGNIQTMFAISAAVLPYMADGRVRGLAITSAKRATSAPDLPTMIELGYPGFESYAWIGLLAPGKTPPEIVAKLEGATRQATALPEVRDALTKQGFDVVGGSAAEFDAFRRSEATKWTEIIQRVGVKADQ